MESERKTLVYRPSLVETIIYTYLAQLIQGGVDYREQVKIMCEVLLDKVEVLSLENPEVWELLLKYVEKQFNKEFSLYIPPLKINPDLHDFRRQMYEHLVKYYKKLPLKAPLSDYHAVRKELEFIVSRITLIGLEAVLRKIGLKYL